jgi:phage terminase small subunit
MTDQPLNTSEVLTGKTLKFVIAWQGDAVAAAAAAGYKHPKTAAYRLMKNSHINKEIRRKQTIMIEESARHLAAQLNFTRSHVLNRLWEIAQMTPDETNGNAASQVRASEALASLFNSKEAIIGEFLTEIATKTPDEIRLMVVGGEALHPSGDPK